MKMVIEGVLTTASYFHVTTPDKGWRYNPDTRRIFQGKKGGFPCTVTRKISVRSPLAVSEDNPLGIERLPLIPAQGLKGKLRRLAAADVEDALIAIHDEKPSFMLYQAAHSGAVTGNPDGGVPTLDEAKARRDHFFAGLFGGGTRMIPGRLRVTDGRLLSETLLEAGAIPERYRDERVIGAGMAYRLVESVPIARRDDALQFADPRAQDVIQDYDQAMLEALDRKAERQSNRHRQEEAIEEGDDQERSLQALNYLEAVIPGVPFYVRLSVNGTPAQAGMLIAALGRLQSADSDGLGGKAGLGYGAFTHDLTVSLDGQIMGDAFLHGVEQGSAINPDCEGIREVLSAYEQALEETSVEDLSRLLTPTPRGA